MNPPKCPEDDYIKVMVGYPSSRPCNITGDGLQSLHRACQRPGWYVRSVCPFNCSR